MTEHYTPVAGHEVRQAHWGDDDALEVTAVGRFEFLTLTLDGKHEASWKLAGDWVQVVKPEPLPDTWVGVANHGGTWTPTGATSFATAVAKCQQAWGSTPCVAIIHAWTDADGDHAEIERVTK
jgi:hypothetical protein